MGNARPHLPESMSERAAGRGMKRWYFGLGLALGLASSSALSFQEQGAAPVTPAPAEGQQAPAAPADKDLNFSTPKVDPGADAGTEVRIPGLGKLGVLPKMDFGLELLYGANDSKPSEPVEQLPAEDLTIRGSVKHNF
jgi:hypothetical protein